MFITPTNITVADYCAEMLRKQIIVNRDYQRSDKVWPPAAKSFLIETILLNFPIPKLSLYQITDIKSRKTVKEIVDGQQRSQTILDFYNDKLNLSKASSITEAAGKLYSQLNEDLKHRFLDYSLSIDLFVSSTQDEIREVFRRINSYTVPLNPEERRYSMYQGVFKWFIYNLSKKYDQSLVDIGVFGEKQLTRMADSKLYSEIIHALLNGITQTNSRTLDKLYKDYDKIFPEKNKIEKRIEEGLNTLIELEEIHRGLLMKPYNIYSLILAITHMKDPSEKLNSVYNRTAPYKFEKNIVISNLSNLSETLENPDITDTIYQDYLMANLVKTNAMAQRRKRFYWFCKALEPELI